MPARWVQNWVQKIGDAVNLFPDEWKNFDPHELRLLLNHHIGGPGQYDSELGEPGKLYLPLARSDCRVALSFRRKEIVAIEPGPAFDAADWAQISQEIENSILGGPLRVGREYSFSRHRVTGSWRGERSGVQILTPPPDAPRAPFEMADHPFILEFPLQASNFWPVTNYRRLRDHRALTCLLNVLLAGGASFQPRRGAAFWASIAEVPQNHGLIVRLRQSIGRRFRKVLRRPEKVDAAFQVKWAQQNFFAPLGEVVIDKLSPPSELLEILEPNKYYGRIGIDGRGLRIPADLDDLICLYTQMSVKNRAKFNRASFWMDLASRQWTTSVSASFASLVSAVRHQRL
jgi:hypothetical protein